MSVRGDESLTASLDGQNVNRSLSDSPDSGRVLHQYADRLLTPPMPTDKRAIDGSKVTLYRVSAGQHFTENTLPNAPKVTHTALKDRVCYVVLNN